MLTEDAHQSLDHGRLVHRSFLSGLARSSTPFAAAVEILVGEMPDFFADSCNSLATNRNPLVFAWRECAKLHRTYYLEKRSKQPPKSISLTTADTAINWTQSDQFTDFIHFIPLLIT
jgi:hypothetical protein